MPREQGISLKAVILGVLVDVGTTLAIGVVAGVVLAVVFVAQGRTPDEINAMGQDPIILVPSFVIGLACTVFGGFVAGRVAGRSETLHGGLVGLLGALIGIPFMQSYPLWYNVACLVAVVPFAALGGYLATFRRTDASQSSDDERDDEFGEPGDGW